jgi:hypothetical protein
MQTIADMALGKFAEKAQVLFQFCSDNANALPLVSSHGGCPLPTCLFASPAPLYSAPVVCDAYPRHQSLSMVCLLFAVSRPCILSNRRPVKYIRPCAGD